MTAVNNGPLLWSQLEESFRSLYGGCVIAGGCVRDWEHDQSIRPKDIDIFVPVEDDFDFDMRFWNLPDPFNHNRRYCTNDSYGGQSAFGNVLGVAELTISVAPTMDGSISGSFMNTKLNIIGKSADKIDDPSLLIQDFDHSLCQFWWDGKRVLRSAGARESMETGQIKSFREGDRRTEMRIHELKYRHGYERYLPKLPKIQGIKPGSIWFTGYASDIVPARSTFAQRLANMNMPF